MELRTKEKAVGRDERVLLLQHFIQHVVVQK